MGLTKEYQDQFKWRDWESILEHCPIDPQHHILDLGCGPGDISKLLAERSAHVVGIDANHDLIQAAKKTQLESCEFLVQNLRELDVPKGSFDGIWSSFVPAYFIDFPKVLEHWLSFLKPDAWICLVEIDDLLAHNPINEEHREQINRFYDDALSDGRYDFRSGRKLEAALQNLGFRTHSFSKVDPELSFNGPATPEVLNAWKKRFARMGLLQKFFGESYKEFERDFVSALNSPEHKTDCLVICTIGTRVK